MPVGDIIAAEALGLVGAPFRLRGRDVRTGIDCVGLAMLALRRAGVPVAEPASYQLRGTGLERAEAMLRQGGLVASDGAARAGDVILVESGPMQLHLLIRAGDGLVHAHAGLGRVVVMLLPSPWPVLGIWRVED